MVMMHALCSHHATQMGVWCASSCRLPLRRSAGPGSMMWCKSWKPNATSSMPYSHLLSTSGGRASLIAWVAAWGPLCLLPAPCGPTPLPLSTVISCPLFILTTPPCLRSTCPARARGKDPVKHPHCGSPHWSSRALLTLTLFLRHMSNWDLPISRAVKLCQMGCTPPPHKVHSREQERAAAGVTELMLGANLHCPAPIPPLDDGPATWPSSLRTNYELCLSVCWVRKAAADATVLEMRSLFYCLFMLLRPGWTLTWLSNVFPRTIKEYTDELWAVTINWLLRQWEVSSLGHCQLTWTSASGMFLDSEWKHSVNTQCYGDFCFLPFWEFVYHTCFSFKGQGEFV